MGASLPEVLISLFLSSLILASLMQVYLSHKRQYLQVMDSFELQFDLSWMKDLMRQSIMKAGFTPCAGLNQLLTRDRRYADKPLADLIVQTEGDSFLKASYMREDFAEITEIAGVKTVLASRGFSLSPGKPVLIADCSHAEVHDVDRVEHRGQGSWIHLQKPLAFSYADKIYIGEWVEETWLLQTDARGKKGFYFSSRHLEELSVDIKDFQVSVQTNKGKKLIDILLQSKKNIAYHFVTGMRNSQA